MFSFLLGPLQGAARILLTFSYFLTMEHRKIQGYLLCDLSCNMEMDDGKEWKMMQKDAKSKKTWNMFEDILALCEEIFFLRSNSTPFCLNKVTIPSIHPKQFIQTCNLPPDQSPTGGCIVVKGLEVAQYYGHLARVNMLHNCGFVVFVGRCIWTPLVVGHFLCV